jgi:hypothetical protein
LGYKNDKKISSNIKLSINGENCHDADTVSNYFNDFFFTSVASKLVEKLPSSKKKYDLGFEKLSCLSFIPITVESLLKTTPELRPPRF